jgi:hypothetical protein
MTNVHNPMLQRCEAKSVMEIVKGNFANKKEKKKIYEEKWS